MHGRDHLPGGADPVTIGGLQYNIAEMYGPYNVGDWLDVKTTSFNPSTTDSIRLNALTPSGSVRIDALQGSIFIEAAPTTETGQIVITSGTIYIDSGPDGTTSMYGAVMITGQNVSDGPNITLFGTGAAAMTVKDGSAAKIFEIRADGSIHGRAATGAITWDL